MRAGNRCRRHAGAFLPRQDRYWSENPAAKGTPAMNDAASVIDYLERTKATYIRHASGLTEEQWRFKPAAARWSVADCPQHLAPIEYTIFGPPTARLKAP